ncbi:MAG: formate/nitrite transporter family protein [Spirochaetia bacterium]|nr:formate/nitrite transporter family protein [Spirochaetia bacterium]
MLNNIKLSILSGLMIAVGGTIYLSCIAKGWTPFGAVLFAAGLYTICVYGFNLYTGKVGYIAYNFKDVNYIGLVILILVFNLITTYLLGIVCAYAFPAIVEPAKKIYEAKLAAPLLRLLITGIFCGLLMFLAVDTWKKGSPFGCFIYIPVFIISGFDHSIANSFYNGVANGFADAFTMQNALVVITVVIGNAIGGMLVPMMTRVWKEAKNS